MKSLLFIFLTAIGIVFLNACTDDNKASKLQDVSLSVVFKDGKFKIKSTDSQSLNINGVYISILDDEGNSVMNLLSSNSLQIYSRFPALPYNGHHVATTFNNDKVLKVYIDGVLVKDTIYNYSGTFTHEIDYVDIGEQNYNNG